VSITSAEDALFPLDSDSRFGPCEHTTDAETQTVFERRAVPEAFDVDSSARIVISDVHKTFTLHTQGGTKLAVLANAALCVDAGECVALTGPSGTGKSTLLRCLYGNYLPTQGSIYVRHEHQWIDLTTADPTQIVQLRKSTLGWVSQFLRVIPRIETLDIVAEPLTQQGVAKADARDRAATILTRLNVPEKLWSLAPATFSGGEQQRVNVARGLVGDHGILLIDEPTASLDPANCEVVVSLLCEARDKGTALVGIFHDPAVRDAVATRVLDINSLTP
jgi:alpha-D-ribose 1-methylphosphonate 5-triphosphate synthase subunit PhnL